MAKRRRIESGMREVFHLHGYGEVQTPAFEHAGLFIARSGPQILEQIYDFPDKGGRHMALRPELTAPVMRFYSSELKNEAKPLRLYYFGNCFRYERPQAGRYREFWQIGLEYIGKRTVLADAEVVSTAIEAVLSSGVKEFRTRIGHVRVLRSLLRRYGIDPAVDKEVMIAIDKKDRDMVEKALSGRSGEGIESITDLLTTLHRPDDAVRELASIAADDSEVQEYCTEIKELLRLLSGYPTEIYFDPSISRGLDYYDGMVFEIDIPSLGAEKQVCGGGAYSLTSVFGTDVEGIGFAIGFDRIMVALGGTSSPASQSGIAIIPLGEEANLVAFKLQRELVSKGHACILETQGRNLKKSLSAASAQGSAYAIILGSEEIAASVATVKDLGTGEQARVPIGSISDHILTQALAKEKNMT
jgi:histidyl-tRNA synthetase